MNRKMLAVGLAALAGTTVAASARPAVYSTGFESPPFVAGSGPGGQLIPGAGVTGPTGPGQDAWLMYSSAVLSSNPHVIADASKAYQGTNYLNVNTGSGTAGFGTSTSSRSTFIYHSDPLTSAQLAGKVLHASVAMFIEPITGVNRVHGQTIQVYDGAFNLYGAMRIQYGASTSTSNGVFFYGYNGVSVIGLSAVTENTWWRMDMYVDFSVNKIFYFVNGFDQSSLLDSLGMNRSFTPADYSETDLVDSRFASASGGSTQGSNHRWDSFSISVDDVPAPSSAALLGLGGLIAARRRRS